MYSKKVINQLQLAEIIEKPTNGWLYSVNEQVGNYGYFEINHLNEVDLIFDGIEDKPCFLFDCDVDKWEGINIDYAIECSLCEWVDGAADQINQYDELTEFIYNWNSKQNVRQYFPNYSRIIVLDKDKFNELIASNVLIESADYD